MQRLFSSARLGFPFAVAPLFRRALVTTATASSSSQAQPLYPPADAKTETRAPSERPPTFPVSFGTPRMMVLGLGGAGGNAVNNMVRAARPKGGSSSTNNNSSAAAQAHGAARYDGVRFMAANTDAQALSRSLAERTIRLGEAVTQGLGAGARPDVGREAALRSLDLVMEEVSQAHVLFLAAGMGGGTGTGAAPVIAEAARSAGVLTIGVVSTPFAFEGLHRMRIAQYGLELLEPQVDTLVVLPNQNLFRVANERTSFQDAFRMADEVLCMTVRSVTDLIGTPGLINLDFADLASVVRDAGRALFGMGEAGRHLGRGASMDRAFHGDGRSGTTEADDRSIRAVDAALRNPLLDDFDISRARGTLISIAGGRDMLLNEVDAIASHIQDRVGEHTNIIFGSSYDEALTGSLRVSLIVTGVRETGAAAAYARKQQRQQQQRSSALPLTRWMRLGERSADDGAVWSDARAPGPPTALPSAPGPEATKRLRQARFAQYAGAMASASAAANVRADGNTTTTTNNNNNNNNNNHHTFRPGRFDFASHAHTAPHTLYSGGLDEPAYRRKQEHRHSPAATMADRVTGLFRKHW
ncbi:hypothetical protein CDCA_CDCA02G0783 [Cyanidium caldarium]|uniref:Uncharacterized protein n=1 Tax=Cyanidium caldarium TaxID=2771 RepID=A0AAV9IRT5_CYACA|nr:hypothetical protein CDCA_CDCA02G0783 [Cyanidium caldarium]